KIRSWLGTSCLPHPPAAPGTSPLLRGRVRLPRAAPPGAEAFDLASLGRRDVVRTASHLAHESLLLHLAAELAQRLFELLGVLDDYSHNPSRIQAGRLRGAHPESSTARAGYVTDSAG